jgi:hypothetical protein
VKGLGILAVVAAVLFVILHAVSGGIGHMIDHGTPGRGPAAANSKHVVP